jgi:hypothetical protein
VIWAPALSGNRPSVSKQNAARQRFSLAIRISAVTRRSKTTSMCAAAIFTKATIATIKSANVQICVLPQTTHEEGCADPAEEGSERRCRKIRDCRISARRKMLEILENAGVYKK